MLVPAAGSVSTFLLAWELMAAASLVLVPRSITGAAVRQAAVFYAVMTQLGFAAILLGLMVLSAAGGADRFADLSAVRPPVPGPWCSCSRWQVSDPRPGCCRCTRGCRGRIPRRRAPSRRLMSAAMVNLGIYGIIRIDLQLLGPGPAGGA